MIYNDRFGYLTTNLLTHQLEVVTNTKSQEKSIIDNLKNLELTSDDIKWKTPIDIYKSDAKTIVLKMPKSLDLLELNLNQISKNISGDCQVYCGFMTKYFSKKMLVICSKYFENVVQTKAKKKARLIILSGKKEVNINRDLLIKTINYKFPKVDITKEYHQYFGVFSANHIDYATQFLLEHLHLEDNYTKVLDLASGNGIIASYIQQLRPNIEIVLLDDSYLAIASSKMNIKGEKISYHYDDNLGSFDDKTFDLIVSNPPFHFEHETNIEITLKLLSEAKRCLNKNGKLILVANIHLNYTTHLERIFDKAIITDRNEKYEIIECTDLYDRQNPTYL
ncbi:MAG: methyltransferase [Saprospiraceae bacterium]